jgi:5-formyltetrahydrofolate cyclo-ligase
LEPPADPQELVPPRRLTMALVPGMGFDGKGRRLGRGAGYFDSLLSDTKPECLKIGIGFKEQLMATELPEEEHDVKMDKLLIDGKLIDLE